MNYRIFLQPVTGYQSGSPLYYPENHRLRRIELGRTDDLLSFTQTLGFNADITQTKSRVAQAGRLTIELDNKNGVWLDKIGNETRGHLLDIMTAGNVLIWRGFSENVSLSGNNDAALKIRFRHFLDALDDLTILGANGGHVLVDEVLTDIANELPDLPSFGNATARRPLTDFPARDWLGMVLAGTRKLLFVTRNGGLALKTFGDWGEVVANFTDENLLSIDVIDEKRNMFNFIQYDFLGSGGEIEKGEFRGTINRARSPEIYRRKYGRRELRLDLRIYNAAEALEIARDLMDYVMIPRRRFKVRVANEQAFQIGDVVRLDLAHIRQSPVAILGNFWVVGTAIDLATQTSQIELIEVN